MFRDNRRKFVVHDVAKRVILTVIQVHVRFRNRVKEHFARSGKATRIDVVVGKFGKDIVHGRHGYLHSALLELVYNLVRGCMNQFHHNGVHSYPGTGCLKPVPVELSLELFHAADRFLRFYCH